LRLAVVVNQAPGLGGTPRTPPDSGAVQIVRGLRRQVARLAGACLAKVFREAAEVLEQPLGTAFATGSSRVTIRM
jgi:hypothetical protein